MSESKKPLNGWLILVATALIGAFLLFVPVKTSTGPFGYSKTTWDLVVGNR